MAKFIIDTDLMAADANESHSKHDYIISALRAAHSGLTISRWLTPYKEKKKPLINPSGDYTPAFLLFCCAYPSRNGKRPGKRPTFKAWSKAVEVIKETLPGQTKETILLEQCLVALDWQVKHESWTKDNGQFIPMAATYLNAESWEEEKPTETKKKNIAKSY